MPAESNLPLVCQEIVYKYLPYLAIGLGLYYGLITIAHAYLLPPPAARVMAGLAGFSSLALLGIFAGLKAFPPPVSWAHRIELVMAEIVLLNSLGHLYFLADLRQTDNIALAIVGGGVLFLSARWLAAFLATCLAGWALVIWTAFPIEGWTHYAFMLVTATTISVLAHTVRVTGIRQLEGTRMVIQEIELRKRAEQEQARLETELLRAEKINSMRVLAGGIAHDFNNLLAGMLGNAELARKEFGPQSRVEPYLAEISDAARCAADLTREMLDFSGNGNFLIEPVGVRGQIEEMARLLRASIPKNVRFEHNVPESLPAIEADATQVRHIIMNLTMNAADAIAERQGAITFSAGTERLDAAPPETEHWFGDRSWQEYVFLRVSDSGSGMDAETQRRIFEPFFSTKFTGRGLGLAAVLGIMRGHHGGVRVETSTGNGTAVTVWFPRSERAPAPPPPPLAEFSHVKGEGTVMVVDDEHLIRRLVRRILERHGFRVVTAEDGAEALKLLAEEGDRIRLVVLDLTMPKMGGRETLEKLLTVAPGLPIVLTSGYNEADISERAGVEKTSFLHKPFLPSDLLDAIAGALGRRGESAVGTG